MTPPIEPAGESQRTDAIRAELVSKFPRLQSSDNMRRYYAYAAEQYENQCEQLERSLALKDAELEAMRRDMAIILQTACDADEAPAKELLSQIAKIAATHPWNAAIRENEGRHG